MPRMYMSDAFARPRRLALTLPVALRAAHFTSCGQPEEEKQAALDDKVERAHGSVERIVGVGMEYLHRRRRLGRHDLGLAHAEQQQIKAGEDPDQEPHAQY